MMFRRALTKAPKTASGSHADKKMKITLLKPAYLAPSPPPRTRDCFGSPHGSSAFAAPVFPLGYENDRCLDRFMLQSKKMSECADHLIDQRHKPRHKAHIAPWRLTKLMPCPPRTLSSLPSSHQFVTARDKLTRPIQ